MSCGNQSTYNRVANAGNLHRLSPFQMPFGILHNLTGNISFGFLFTEKVKSSKEIVQKQRQRQQIGAATGTEPTADEGVVQRLRQ